MSQFVTKLTVPLSDTLKLLPTGAHLDAIAPRIDLDAQTAEIEIVWSHDALRAPCQSGNEFPKEVLKARKVPAGVKVIPKPEPPKKEKLAETKSAETGGSTPPETSPDSQPPESAQ